MCPQARPVGFLAARAPGGVRLLCWPRQVEACEPFAARESRGGAPADPGWGSSLRRPRWPGPSAPRSGASRSGSPWAPPCCSARSAVGSCPHGIRKRAAAMSAFRRHEAPKSHCSAAGRAFSCWTPGARPRSTPERVAARRPWSGWENGRLGLLAAGRPLEVSMGRAVAAPGYPVYRFAVSPRVRRPLEET